MRLPRIVPIASAALLVGSVLVGCGGSKQPPSTPADGHLRRQHQPADRQLAGRAGRKNHPRLLGLAQHVPGGKQMPAIHQHRRPHPAARDQHRRGRRGDRLQPAPHSSPTGGRGTVRARLRGGGS